MPPRIDDHSLSRILSGRARGLEWESFTPADLDLLIRKAQAEGVAPLIYWMLSESGELSRLPSSLAKSLRAAYFSTRMNNEGIINEMESLARRFEQAGISAVALKGICYALTLYPDIGLRPMVDLDLLVPASKLSEAARIAKDCGYAQAVPEASPGLTDLLSHHVCLKKGEMPYTRIELHHSLVADKSISYAVPVDWFWSQTEPLVGLTSHVKVINLRMLTPTAQVLYACAHAMLQHGGRNTGLRWVYDIDRLIRFYAGRIDWNILLTQARTFEWDSAVEAALSRTAAFFETPIPQEVLDTLRKNSDRNAERVAKLQHQPVSHTLEEYQKLQSLDWYGRYRLAVALAIPSPAYMRWRYDLKTSWSLPAWYLYRWWGIIMDAIKTVWMLARKAVAKVGISGSLPNGSPDESQ